MASNYPTSIDSFTDPLSNSPLNNPSHAAQHQDVNDAVEKLETKLGVGSSPASGAASGHVLVANGSGSTTWQAPAVTAAQFANVGLTYITESTIAGTNRALTLDNIFTSTYDNYRIVGKFRSTIATNALFFQLLNSSGTALNTNYYGTAYGQDYASPGTGFTTNSATTVGYVGWIPNSSSVYLTFSFDIFAPAIAADATSWAGQHTGLSSGSSYLGGQFLGARTVADANRGLRFDNGGAGNLTGAVTVYGYRKG